MKGSDDGNWKLNTGNREKGTGWKPGGWESGTRRRWPTHATERERVAILDRVNERESAIGSEGWTSAGDGDGGGSRRLKRGISKRKANEREVRDERATREGDDDGLGGR